VFQLDVAYVWQWFSNVFQAFSTSVSSAFKRMLQLLHLDVSKVNQMLHLPHRFLLPRLGVSSSSRRWLGIRRLISLFLDDGDVRGGAGPV
jgi:hypothetical protein